MLQLGLVECFEWFGEGLLLIVDFDFGVGSEGRCCDGDFCYCCQGMNYFDYGIYCFKVFQIGFVLFCFWGSCCVGGCFGFIFEDGFGD